MEENVVTALNKVILRVAEAISNERNSTTKERLVSALFELTQRRESLRAQDSDQAPFSPAA